MFISADTLTYLMSLGLNGEKLIELVRRLDADAQAVAPVSDAAREKKRERDRERYRQRIRGETASETAAEFAAKPPAESGEQDAGAPVHARGENNLSKLVDIPNLTTLNASDADPDLDWPGEAKPSRAYLDRLEAALFEAGAPALNLTAPKILSLAAILALGREGKGPPCDLQADVLPTVRAKCARGPPASIAAWDYLVPAICEARDRRLRGAPETRPLNQGSCHERPDQPSAKRTSREDNLARAFAGSEAATRSRAVG